MFLFSFHTALALQLIALTFGAWLLMHTQSMAYNKYIVSKVIAYLVIILSIISIGTNIYFTKMMWQEGLTKVYPMMLHHKVVENQQAPEVNSTEDKQEIVAAKDKNNAEYDGPEYKA
jgi:type VI protein secretion system component VasK